MMMCRDALAGRPWDELGARPRPVARERRAPSGVWPHFTHSIEAGVFCGTARAKDAAEGVVP